MLVSIQKFDNIKIKTEETVNEFNERFNYIVIRQASLGKDYRNRVIALNVMRALLRERNVKTIHMRELKDLNKIEPRDLFADLKVYDFDLRIRNDEKTFTSQLTKDLVVA